MLRTISDIFTLVVTVTGFGSASEVPGIGDAVTYSRPDVESVIPDFL